MVSFMHRAGFLKTGLALGAALALASTPAMAGRCGHAYAVDAPVTLAKVARACNVSLSALKEANPSVNPDYVRPGEHLALPDEMATPADVPAGALDLAMDGGEASMATIYRYAEYVEPARAGSTNNGDRISSNDADAPSPYFIRASAYASPEIFHDEANLSYQKRAASRIRHAGVRAAPILPPSMARPSTPESITVSTTSEGPRMLSGAPLSPLMECASARREADGKVRQVRIFKPLAEGRTPPANCALVEKTA